jgi:multiple sugar transport system substrate-binding protein
MNEQRKAGERQLSRRGFLQVSAAGVASVTAGSLLSGCAPVAPGAAPAVVSSEPVTIKVMSWWWVEKGSDVALRNLVEKFEAAYPEIKVEEVSFPSNIYEDAQYSQMAAGKLDADVMHTLEGTGIKLIEGGFLEPLNDVGRNAGIWEYDAIKKIPPWFWSNRATFDDTPDDSGDLYVLMFNTAQDGLIYNMDIIEQAGASLPETQDEAYELAKALTDRPNQFGWANRHTVPEKVGFFRDMIPWLLGYGGVYADGQQPTVNTEAMINTLAHWRRMYLDCFPQGSDAATFRRMIAEGKVALYTDNNALPPNFFNMNPDSESFIRSAALPWPNRKGASFPSYWAWPADSPPEKKEAARTFLEFWATPDNFKEMTWARKDPPMIPQANTPEYLESLPWMSGFATTDAVPWLFVMGGYQGHVEEFRTIVVEHASEVVVGTISPEEGAQRAQQELEVLADQLFG